MRKFIAITDGIGAGKSVVSKILTALGYNVYDCDSRAKELMDRSQYIKERLKKEISANVIAENGEIDRKVLSSIVFTDKSKLDILNSITHNAVKQDILKWSIERDNQFLFIETAILYQSGLDKMVHEVWEVTAPENIRIARVCHRNNISEQEVRNRIESQRFQIEVPHHSVKYIINDNATSVVLQVNALIVSLSQ